jgi:hypothetical protein
MSERYEGDGSSNEETEGVLMDVEDKDNQPVSLTA